MVLKIALFLSMLSVVSCAEFRGLQREGSSGMLGDLSIGDTVQIVTSDSQVLEFEVVDITDDAIVGEHVNVPIEKIADIKREEFDKVETAKGVGFGAFSAAAIGLIIILATASFAVMP